MTRHVTVPALTLSAASTLPDSSAPTSWHVPNADAVRATSASISPASPVQTGSAKKDPRLAVSAAGS